MTDREMLENAVRSRPDDVAAHAAYADLLIEQDDPLGNFIRLHLALEDETLTSRERSAHRKHEKELLKVYRQEWVGNWPDAIIAPSEELAADYGFDPAGGKKYQLERGLLKAIFVGELNIPGARAIRDSGPKTRFVNKLFIGGLAYGEVLRASPDIPEEISEDDAPAYPLLAWPQLPFLRNFHWGWPTIEPYQDHRCHLSGDFVPKLVEKMPLLEELAIYAHLQNAERIVDLTLPHLKSLTLYHGWSFPLETLAENESLANLETLHCHPHALEYGEEPYITLDGLQALCQSKKLKSLQNLRLRLTTFGDEGVREIVKSGLLKRLKTLDLALGCVTDEGAALLAASPDFQKLKQCDVSYNAMTPKGVALLKKTGVDLLADSMHDETEGDERNYLQQGDYE